MPLLAQPFAALPRSTPSHRCWSRPALRHRTSCSLCHLPYFYAFAPPSHSFQVLERASTEVRQMDVLCWDTVSEELLLLDFHSMLTIVSETANADSA